MVNLSKQFQSNLQEASTGGTLWLNFVSKLTENKLWKFFVQQCFKNEGTPLVSEIGGI